MSSGLDQKATTIHGRELDPRFPRNGASSGAHALAAPRWVRVPSLDEAFGDVARNTPQINSQFGCSIALQTPRAPRQLTLPVLQRRVQCEQVGQPGAATQLSQSRISTSTKPLLTAGRARTFRPSRSNAPDGLLDATDALDAHLGICRHMPPSGTPPGPPLSSMDRWLDHRAF